MRRCKINYCKEEAVPYGKRYCPTHLAAYKKKRAVYLEIEKNLPKCESGISPECQGVVGVTRSECGLTTCKSCARVILELEESQQKREQEIRSKLDQVMMALQRGENFTVPQLHDLQAAFKEVVVPLIEKGDRHDV